MSPVNKALWYIESHFTGEITLDEVADIAEVSRFHLSRAFGSAVGLSLQQYVRGRRLTEAARRLANGAPDILSLALDVGYGSHEAFTRAFRDQFGVTPETIRDRKRIDNLQLVEPIKMNETPFATIESPRIVQGTQLLIAGLGERYNDCTAANMPAQWQKFGPMIGTIPGQIGSTAYGVICNSDDEGNVDYICGVEVKDFAALPASLSRIRIPAQRYAVFAHREHIATIRRTWFTIFNKGLSDAKLTMIDAPQFEKYGPSFDPRTGNGGLEIWIPVA
jgi:AraC family transcriptional regulator